MRKSLVVCMGALLFGLAACAEATSPRAASSVIVTAPVQQLASGASVQLTASAIGRDGSPLTDLPLTWSSSDTSIARVSPTGLVTAGQVFVGVARSVEIIAASGAASGRVTLSVQPVPVSSVQVTAASVTLQAGAVEQLTVSAVGASGTVLSGRAVAWTSSDTTVVSVSPSGLAAAVAYLGEAVRSAIIRATVEGKQDTVRLTVLPPPVRQVVAGRNSSCLLSTAGTAFCWGSNESGELGNASGVNSLTPVVVSTDVKFASLSAGRGTGFGAHMCGLTVAGAAHCWGENTDGQVGDGSTTLSSVPVLVQGAPPFRQLTAGSAHTCGVTFTSAAFCWGQNSLGQLGDSTKTGRVTPVPVGGGLSFVQLSAGIFHTCGLTSTGNVYCWGRNNWGQIGDGTTTDRYVPTQVQGQMRFTQLAAGGHNACGLTEDGTAYCWGANLRGALGDGSTADRFAPTPVATALRFTRIVGGAFRFCALASDGALYCWGQNGVGQVGDGGSTDRLTPTLVSGGMRFVDVSSASNHSCALTASGAGYCWGSNTSGQLGDGTTINRSSPVAILRNAP